MRPPFLALRSIVMGSLTVAVACSAPARDPSTLSTFGAMNLAKRGQPVGELFTSHTLRRLTEEDVHRLGRAYLVFANKALERGEREQARSIYHALVDRSDDDVIRCAAIRGLGRTFSNAHIGQFATILRVADDPSARVQNALIDALVDMADWDLHRLQGLIGSFSGRISVPPDSWSWSPTPTERAILLRAMARCDIDLAKRRLAPYLLEAAPEIRLTVLDLVTRHPPVHGWCETGLYIIAQDEKFPREREMAIQGYLALADQIAGEGNLGNARDMYEDALRFNINRASQEHALRGLGGTAGDARSVLVIRDLAAEDLDDEAQSAIVTVARRMAARGLTDQAIKALQNLIEEAASPEVKRTAEQTLRRIQGRSQTPDGV